MNFDKLRLVAELANVGRQQEAVLATVMPEELEASKDFVNCVGVHMFLNLKNFKSGWNLLDLRLPILQKVTWLKITYDICKLFSSGIICELSARNFMWAMSSKLFGDVPYNLLLSCIEHPHLTVHSEMHLSDALLVWVDANAKQLENFVTSKDCHGIFRQEKEGLAISLSFLRRVLTQILN
ncbi:uncharacterized protein LOC142642595 isoform X2 [Castanea sativa]|uniref:uncharacterized protein LOC142642595 isoform X2 n=1 Tax=Castanea sativa TaxID=21020 RepID=UPI003F653D5D